MTTSMPPSSATMPLYASLREMRSSSTRSSLMRAILSGWARTAAMMARMPPFSAMVAVLRALSDRDESVSAAAEAISSEWAKASMAAHMFLMAVVSAVTTSSSDWPRDSSAAAMTDSVSATSSLGASCRVSPVAVLTKYTLPASSTCCLMVRAAPMVSLAVARARFMILAGSSLKTEAILSITAAEAARTRSLAAWSVWASAMRRSASRSRPLASGPTTWATKYAVSMASAQTASSAAWALMAAMMVPIVSDCARASLASLDPACAMLRTMDSSVEVVSGSAMFASRSPMRLLRPCPLAKAAAPRASGEAADSRPRVSSARRSASTRERWSDVSVRAPWSSTALARAVERPAMQRAEPAKVTPSPEVSASSAKECTSARTPSETTSTMVPAETVEVPLAVCTAAACRTHQRASRPSSDATMRSTHEARAVGSEELAATMLKRVSLPPARPTSAAEDAMTVSVMDTMAAAVSDWRLASAAWARRISAMASTAPRSVMSVTTSRPPDCASWARVWMELLRTTADLSAMDITSSTCSTMLSSMREARPMAARRPMLCTPAAITSGLATSDSAMSATAWDRVSITAAAFSLVTTPSRSAMLPSFCTDRPSEATSSTVTTSLPPTLADRACTSSTAMRPASAPVPSTLRVFAPADTSSASVPFLFMPAMTSSLPPAATISSTTEASAVAHSPKKAMVAAMDPPELT
mmetsp:Transcript_10418/g.40523  ORF Transcript_10418/g.40523 Transcript_10418/m.40523 type:complete len:701 (+) Transcript_10418:2083-4185(+)